MWRFESVHSFGSVGKLYQKMHFVGSNLSTGSEKMRRESLGAEIHLQNFEKLQSQKPSERSHFVCAKRNFIGRKPTSLRSTSFARSATSFICAASGNDVLASLEMMLPLRANDVVPAAQMKNPKAELSDFCDVWPI